MSEPIIVFALIVATSFITTKIMAIHYLNIIDDHTREMTKLFVKFLEDLLRQK